MPAHLVVAALALGNTIGQTAVAIPMVIATRRIRGPAAVQGIGHATASGLAAGAAGAAVGAAVCLASPTGGKLVVTGVAVLAASGAVIAFGVVAFILDRGDLRTVVARLRLAGPAAGVADQVAASCPWSGRPPRRAVTACRMEQDPRHWRSRVHRLCAGPAPLRALPSAGRPGWASAKTPAWMSSGTSRSMPPGWRRDDRADPTRLAQAARSS